MNADDLFIAVTMVTVFSLVLLIGGVAISLHSCYVQRKERKRIEKRNERIFNVHRFKV